MPYIPQNEREHLNKALSPILRKSTTAGQLNYILTKIVLDYLDAEDKCYTVYAEVLGTLRCVELELYRRQIVAYEDKKKKQHGDVF